MSSLINGLTFNIVARYGLSSDVPTLITGELGYDTDTKVGRIGDDTPEPPKVLTEKTVGEFAFKDLTSLTLCGLTFQDGKINGIDLSGLNTSNGLLTRKGSGKFGTSVLRSGDQSLTVTGGNGNGVNIDIRVNMATLQSRLGVANLPFVKKAGDIMSGPLELPEVDVFGAAGTLRQTSALTGSLKRWGWGGDAESENGSNSGTDWALTRYSDSGTVIDQPFWVDRASGYAYVKHGLVMPDGTVIVKAPVLPPDAKGYLFNDGSGHLSWVDVTLSAATLTISPITIAAAVQTIAYSQTFTANGGTAPYTFSSSGSLPTGLSLSPSGVLSGTPTQSGSFSFTISASDSTPGSAITGSRAYTLVVSAVSTDPGAPDLTISPASLPNAQRGVAYTQSVSASGGTGPYTYARTAGALPAGLSMSSAGSITGTPTESGSFTFTVTASDSSATQGVKSQVYTLVVDAAQFTFVVNYNIDNLNLFQFANSPTAVGDYIFIINPGVYVRSADPAIPALSTGVFPSGSTLKIINNGDIQGAGGRGGNAVAATGGAPSEFPETNVLLYRMVGSTIHYYSNYWDGGNGGNAVSLDMAATIDNTNGRIFGGGGGGMGAVSTSQQLGGSYVFSNAGGGGGGQGAYTTNGGSGVMGGMGGQYGGPSNPGVGGSGPTYTQFVGGSYESGGGTYTITGQNGANGAAWGQNAASLPAQPAVAGVAYDNGTSGTAGKAVARNAKTVTWIGGNNANQIKGAVS